MTKGEQSDEVIRRKEQLLLIEQEEWQFHVFEAMLSSITDFVCIFNNKGEFIYSNQALLDLLEIELDEILGKTFFDLSCPHELAERLQRQIQQVFKGEKTVKDEASYTNPRGSEGYYEYIFSPVVSSDGSMEFVACLARDITERKENEYMNAWLGAIINGSDDAIISKNLDGIITSWNKGAERMFGYTPDEAIGRSITIIIPANRIDEEDKILDRLRRGERIDHYETIRRRKDGISLNISLTISPVKDSTGQIMGASKIARNITRQKQAEKELQKKNEMLEERTSQLRSLASQLSKAGEQERRRLGNELHDNLAQILAVAKMNLVGLQKDQHTDQTEIDELGDLLNKAIIYTRDLMSDLKPPPSINKDDLGALVGWVAKKMKRYDLDVTVEDDDRPKPLSEKIRTTLIQGVRELLFNIVKHTNVKQARVVLSRSDKRVQITVEDRGKGFDPKKRQDSANEGDNHFGLFNVSEQMDLLGGSLKINSEPGKGTKIILRAPLKEEHKKLEPTQPRPQVKILLVDDHGMIRKGLRKIIEEEDDLMIIAEASDGQEAIQSARETSPDVIVMDVNMPKMDGIQATKKIKSALPDIHIIGLSLHGRKEVIRDMRSAGASAYVTKDEAFKTLCATIRSEAAVAKG